MLGAYRGEADFLGTNLLAKVSDCFERLLVERGVLTAAGAEELKRSILAEANDATDRAEAMPYPAAGDLYTNVYADGWEPWRSFRDDADTQT